VIECERWADSQCRRECKRVGSEKTKV
jgi:hypothetical protein